MGVVCAWVHDLGGARGGHVPHPALACCLTYCACYGAFRVDFDIVMRIHLFLRGCDRAPVEVYSLGRGRPERRCGVSR